jgi:hypothetical protein
MVSRMKKYILIILIILLLIFNNSNKSITVFNETSNLYEITFINNLSTDNFLSYFNDIKVIWIKPRMNILYEDQLKKYNKYYFKEMTNNKNINAFKKEYINYINNLGYKNEAIKLQTSGIMIEKIKVYMNSEELSYIKMSLNDIKIENID